MGGAASLFKENRPTRLEYPDWTSRKHPIRLEHASETSHSHELVGFQ
jgi:hypothetical protein